MGFVRGRLIQRVNIAQGGTPATLELVADPNDNSYARVVAIVLSSPAAGTLKFQSGGTDITGAINVAANGGFRAIGDVENPVLEGRKNANLAIVSAGAGAGANGYIRYYLDAASPAVA